MQHVLKYLTLAPVMATFTMVVLSVVLIMLQIWFPGLQDGTYFKPTP